MRSTETINFKDKSFPIMIAPRRASAIVDTAIHEEIEIKYFYEGETTLLIGNKTVNAQAGDMVIINPYEFHATLDAGKEEKGKYILIMIGLDFFSGINSSKIDLRHLIYGKKTVFKTHIRASERLRRTISLIGEESESNLEASKLAIFGLTAELFALLLRDGTEQASTPQNDDIIRYYQIIEPALRMIRDEYQSKFTIDTLSCVCNISKYHFCRIFKTVTGMSTMQYLNDYRLKIADAMLSSTKSSLAEISVKCGFEDLSYFCRLYKKHFGHTPGKLRDKGPK